MELMMKKLERYMDRKKLIEKNKIMRKKKIAK